MIPNTKEIRTIHSKHLREQEAVLVDVRTPEAFGEEHLPGSVNHCVYEVAFTDEFPKAYPDRSTRLVLYGDGAPYKADLAAVGRLQGLGYSNISVLEGGLREWKSSGNAVEGTGVQADSHPTGRLRLDREGSKVRWIGRNFTNQHDGIVATQSGFMDVDGDGSPLAGEVIVDLRQMTCRDIEDSSMAAVLIQHLQNADFFDVGTHPLASFTLQSAKPIEGATRGAPNYRVRGTLEARGKAVPIEMDALVEPIQDRFVFQATFDFDRVELGALYGSGRIFERLGMHLVNDRVTIDVMAFFIK